MSEVEGALWRLEEALAGVLGFAQATGYGLRLARKRIGDLTVSALEGKSGAAGGSEELTALKQAIEHSEDQLSDLLMLTFGDHFREFLARALALSQRPPLPVSPAELEELAGTPGAFADRPFWFTVGLLLSHAALNAGALDARILNEVHGADLEIPFPDGKVKLFHPGDRVTLVVPQFQSIADAYLGAALTIRRHLATS
jgi:hypothetical protein